MFEHVIIKIQIVKKLLVLGAIIVFALAPTKAFSHDHWANGDPIPDWVKKSCCGQSDSHHLRPDQVHTTNGGYIVDGYKNIIPYADARPSLDGDYWIFYKEYNDGYQSPVYCFFIPPSNS